MTWFVATCGELTPLDKATLSTVVWLLKLSTSEAEEDGDSPGEMQEQEWSQIKKKKEVCKKPSPINQQTKWRQSFDE